MSDQGPEWETVQFKLEGKSIPYVRMTQQVEVATLLGEWIEQVREARGHTLEDVAQITGLTTSTLLRMRLKMIERRRRIRTLEVLAEYLMVDEAVVIALGKAPSMCSDAQNMRARQHRVRDRLSMFAVLLDKVRKGMGQTFDQVATELSMCSVTLSKAREIGPSTTMRMWRRLAEYVGRSVEECKELAALPAGTVGRRVEESKESVSSPAVSGAETYPLLTFNGVKWHPMVPAVPCGQCPFCEPCMRDVVADDFAWCEAVIAEDFQPG